MISISFRIKGKESVLDYRGSILVVDDEENILDILDQFLSERNYLVKTARKGELALQMAREFDPGVVLIDIKLPDYNGLELIEKFRAIQPGTKCVVMTGYASMESTIQALRLNAFDYIIKPFDLVKIGEVVDAAFSHFLLKRDSSRIIKRLESANRQLEKSKQELSRRVMKTNRELAHTNDLLKRHVTRLKMLYQMGRDISSSEDWSDSLDRFLMALCSYMDAEGSALLLFSNSGEVLQVRTSYQVEEPLLKEAISTLRKIHNRDLLSCEIFALEGYSRGKVNTCLNMPGKWRETVIPLQYKGRWLGFIFLVKQYKSRNEYLNDYHFITTIQTILTEEVANAVNISRLRNLKNFNQTILENINNGVLKTDREGGIVFLNSKAREMLGVNSVEGLKFDQVFDDPATDGSLFHYLIHNKGSSFSMEVTLTPGGVSRMPIRLSTTRVKTDEFHGKTLVAVFEDLTEQKKMEEELRRNDRLRSIGELSAGVAHEIRNPLTGIATTAQVLKDRMRKESGNVRYISVILDEIKRLDDIITNLMTFARPSSPQPSDFQLRELIAEVAALISREAEREGVRIEIDDRVENDSCYLDRSQIKQVILNIALNGIEACEDGGRVIVKTRDSEDPRYIRIEIEDNGVGIDEQSMEKLYNPFFTTKSEGTGLGLAISRKIMEGNGGILTHRSELGKGTSFFIDLPRKMDISLKEQESMEAS